VIVDSSAIVAILQDEPEASDFAEALAAADRRIMSAASYLELSMVMIDRRGAAAAQPIDRFLSGSLISIAAFNEEQARLAREAFMRFGKGRHKASLNFGDCMTYALARREGLPVLCKGTDFPATDIEVVPMPSAAYKQFVKGIVGKKQVLCTYDGHPRELCPHILGHNKQGEEVSLVLQFGGTSTTPLPREGQWKCLKLAKVSDIRLRDGRWHEGQGHARRQRCVDAVDYDVNPNSPYNPKHSLTPER
jgi:uncharacterized protein with PIN domain